MIDEVHSIKVNIRSGAYNDFALYMGPNDWEDDKVRTSGIKLNVEEAMRMCLLLNNNGIITQETLNKICTLKYRK